VTAVVQTAMIAGLPYQKLRDTVFAHLTMAEGLGFLLGMCRLLELTRPIQRLRQVAQYIVDMLDADRQADIAGADAGGALLVLGQLRMGGAGRVDGEAAGVADIGDVVEQLQRVDEAAAG